MVSEKEIEKIINAFLRKEKDLIKVFESKQAQRRIDDAVKEHKKWILAQKKNLQAILNNYDIPEHLGDDELEEPEKHKLMEEAHKDYILTIRNIWNV